MKPLTRWAFGKYTASGPWGIVLCLSARKYLNGYVVSKTIRIKCFRVVPVPYMMMWSVFNSCGSYVKALYGHKYITPRLRDSDLQIYVCLRVIRSPYLLTCLLGLIMYHIDYCLQRHWLINVSMIDCQWHIGFIVSNLDGKIISNSAFVRG